MLVHRENTGFGAWSQNGTARRGAKVGYYEQTGHGDAALQSYPPNAHTSVNIMAFVMRVMRFVFRRCIAEDGLSDGRTAAINNSPLRRVNVVTPMGWASA